ncbi:MAG: NF038143 family protein, partial [Desulfosalsimonas sp.]
MAELEKKYELILGQGEHFAYSLGKEVIDKPAASAWMILLPVLFVHHAYRIKRYKEGVQSFARGILDPRKKALDAAAHEVRTKTSLPCTMEYLYPEITASAPEKDRSLAEKQVGVIRIHQQHYRNLISAPG